jgi:CTP synthase (UTP-ammonia lyase)
MTVMSFSMNQTRRIHGLLVRSGFGYRTADGNAMMVGHILCTCTMNQGIISGINQRELHSDIIIGLPG